MPLPWWFWIFVIGGATEFGAYLIADRESMKEARRIGESAFWVAAAALAVVLNLWTKVN